jgi:radical SAM protein with 4Fe4S-binding SPASM domain
MTDEQRVQLWREHQRRGWVAYGLRQVVVEEMLPDLMQVETTSVCNLRCVFCPYDQMTRSKQHMDLADFERFLADQAAHVRSIGLHHFGEPFLNRHLPDYVGVCTGLGIDTTVSTNATRISTRQAEAVIGAGLGRLILSLDAVTATDYERLRIGGRFEQVTANIETFLDAKQRLGAGTFVQVQFIATPENHRTWPAFERQWRDQPGVDQVVLRDERSHAGQRVRHNRYRARPGDRYPCRYLWESLVILADGRVVPCCKDYDGKEVLGNVFEGDQLADIWDGPRMVELRRAHVEGRYGHLPLCATCDEWPGHTAMTPAESRDAFVRFRSRKDANRAQPVHRRGFE